MKRVLITLILLGLVSPQAQAACDLRYEQAHKWVDPSTGKIYVYLPGTVGAIPGQSIPGFTSPKAPKVKSLTLNPCGWGYLFKGSNPPLSVSGVDWAGRSTGGTPTCSTGVSSPGSPVGTVIDDGSKYWLRLGTTAATSTVEVVYNSTITLRANQCGFLRVAVTATRPLTTFRLANNAGGTDYNLADLPAVEFPLKCVKVGQTYQIYGWTDF